MATWRRSDDDFADEINAHLANETERLIADGLSPDDARAAARRAFGSVTRTRERFHETRRFVVIEQFAHDLRYAWRGLTHSRAFVASTVLTLAAGMGLVLVVFAIFNAYVLRPFAVQDPYSLHLVEWDAQDAGGATFRWRDYESFRDRTDLFEGVIAESRRTVTSGDRQMSVGFVSGNYFDTLGARVAVGRGLVEADARTPDSEPVVVLTDASWSRLFNRDPAAIGRELEVNGVRLVVVGVVAPEFSGMDEVPRDAWVPITMLRALLGESPFDTGGRPVQVTVRLRHDVTPARAQAALTLEPIEARVRGRLDPVRAELTQRSTPMRLTWSALALLSPVFIAFGLVLVAASANAANVMLARANARHREIGIRLSIGASRGRIVRQLVTEGLLLALLAGTAGLVLAAILRTLGTVAMVAMLPSTIAARVRFVALDFDLRVMLFTGLLAVAVTILFALLPALQATRVTLTDALRGQLTGTIRGGTMRSLLITGQVTVSLVLLIVATTILRNGATIRGIDLGMRTAGVISARENRGNRALFRSSYQALSAHAGLASVAVASRSPLFGEAPRVPLREPTGLHFPSFAFVSPNYFELLGISIVRGRGFSEQEAATEAPVIVVSAELARRLWPNDDPLGQTLRLYIEPPGQRVPADRIREMRSVSAMNEASVPMTVVGVASDTVNGFVYQGVDNGHLYLPTSVNGLQASTLLVRGRTSLPPLDAVRTVLRRISPDPVAFDVLPIDEMVQLQLFPMRAASYVGTLLSGIALIFSVSGLYGVLTYTFGQRKQEIGIRMALGASTTAVERMVFGQSARLASAGTVVGLLAGFAIMKLLSRFVRLANVSVVDPFAFAASIVLIGAAVALAAFWPARQAGRLDPSAMLRADG
jgi:predicted permease